MKITYTCGCGVPGCRRGCFGYDSMRGVGGLGDPMADLLRGASGQALDATTLAFLQSPQFAPVMEAIKQKAREGVIEETKSNALTLLALSAGAGAVGGFIFNGPRGLILGGVVAALAVSRLVKGHS